MGPKKPGKAAKGASAVGPAVDTAEALALRDRVNSGEDLAAELALKFYSVGSPCPLYGQCRGGKSSTCLCSLVPRPGGYKMKGLFHRHPTDLLMAGRPDPNDDRRLGPFAGLRNVGNTCYANTVMQTIFAVTDLRRAIFDCGVEDSQGIMRELRALLGRMQAAPHKAVDTTPFLKAVGVTLGEQQDSQEFWKLLAGQWMETQLAKSPKDEFRTMVQDLFKARKSHVTTCQRCQRISAGSHREEDWYELDLQVQGMGSLEGAIQAYLAEETLEGDSAYHCDHCDARTTATRQVRLKSLPPYLCCLLRRFQLARNARTGDYEKKKVRQALEFPLSLDLKAVGGFDPAGALQAAIAEAVAEGGPGGEYELAAVLVHSGDDNAGHYTAILRDFAGEGPAPGPAPVSVDGAGADVPPAMGGGWWAFDDDRPPVGPSPVPRGLGVRDVRDKEAPAPAPAGGGEVIVVVSPEPKSKGKVSQKKRAPAKGGSSNPRKKRAAASDMFDSDATDVDEVEVEVEGRAARGRGRGRGQGRGKGRPRKSAGAVGQPATDDVVVMVEDDAAPGAGPGSRSAPAPVPVPVPDDGIEVQPPKEEEEEEVRLEVEAAAGPGPGPRSRDASMARNGGVAAGPGPGSAAAPKGPCERLTSNDAYMLLYRRKGFAGRVPPGPVVLPADLQTLMDEERARFAADCARYSEEKAQLVARVAARQAQVRAFYEAAVGGRAATPPPEGPGEAGPSSRRGSVDGGGGGGGGGAGEGGARGGSEEAGDMGPPIPASDDDFDQVVMLENGGQGEDIVVEVGSGPGSGPPLLPPDNTADLGAGAGRKRGSNAAPRAGVARVKTQPKAQHPPAPPPHPSELVVVPEQWLRRFCEDVEAPPPPDTAPLECPHTLQGGEVRKGDPLKCTEMRFIRGAAWPLLAPCYPEGALPFACRLSDWSCEECINALLEKAVEGSNKDQERERVAAQVERLLAAAGGEGEAEGPRGAKGKAARGGLASHAAPVVIEVEEEEGDEAGDVFVSKAWLQAWLKRKCGSLFTGAKNALGLEVETTRGPTGHLTCPHGGLLPDKKGGANSRRIPIPRPLWAYIARRWAEEAKGQEVSALDRQAAMNAQAQIGAAAASAAAAAVNAIIAAQAASGSPGGFPSLPSLPDTSSDPVVVMVEDDDPVPVPVPAPHHVRGPPGPPPRGPDLVRFDVGRCTDCPRCMDEFRKDHEEIADRRSTADQERQALAGLADVDFPCSVEPGTHYSLIQGRWLWAWRSYVGNPKASPPPGPLGLAMDELWCDCKQGLRDAPPPLEERRGRHYLPGNPRAPGPTELVPISAAEYHYLAESYGNGGGELGPNPLERKIVATVDVLPIPEDPYAFVQRTASRRNPAARGTGPTSLPVLNVVPPQCLDCLRKREARQNEASMNFVHVEARATILRRGKEPPPAEPPVTSRRTGRGRPGSAFTVSAIDTFGSLQLLLFQHTDITPNNQRVYVGPMLIQGDPAKTLVELGVRHTPGQVLVFHVSDTEQYDPNDLSGVIPADDGTVPAGGRRRRAEQGFRGSALLGEGSPSAAAAAARGLDAGAAAGRNGSGPAAKSDSDAVEPFMEVSDGEGQSGPNGGGGNPGNARDGSGGTGRGSEPGPGGGIKESEDEGDQDDDAVAHVVVDE